GRGRAVTRAQGAVMRGHLSSDRPRAATLDPMLDLVEEVVLLRPAGAELSVLRPRDSEALLDEHAFEDDEFLPYWAELWPSGVALARVVADLDLTGKRVVELRAGPRLASV